MPTEPRCTRCRICAVDSCRTDAMPGGAAIRGSGARHPHGQGLVTTPRGRRRFHGHAADRASTSAGVMCVFPRRACFIPAHRVGAVRRSLRCGRGGLWSFRWCGTWGCCCGDVVPPRASGGADGGRAGDRWCSHRAVVPAGVRGVGAARHAAAGFAAVRAGGQRPPGRAALRSPARGGGPRQCQPAASAAHVGPAARTTGPRVDGRRGGRAVGRAPSTRFWFGGIAPAGTCWWCGVAARKVRTRRWSAPPRRAIWVGTWARCWWSVAAG